MTNEELKPEATRRQMKLEWVNKNYPTPWQFEGNKDYHNGRFRFFDIICRLSVLVV